MGFNIARNGLEETCFVIAVVGVTLAIMATVLRFIAVRKARRKPSWEDWCAVLATFFFIIYVIPLIYLLRQMNGTAVAKLSKQQVVRIKKAGYSMGPQFCMQQLFAKLSLLFLYHRIFNVNRSFVFCIYLLGAIQIAWSIATYFAHYFECTPVKKLWEPTIPGHCINSPVFLAAGETPNSLVDFALIGLAIWMVQKLRIDTALKLKLGGIFIIGGLAGILGFVKISEGFGATQKSKVELLDPIWAVVQQTCSIICCCAPVYKTIIPNFGFFEKLQSLTTLIFTRSSKSASLPVSVQGGANGTNEMTARRKSWKGTGDWVQLDEVSLKHPSSANGHQEV